MGNFGGITGTVDSDIWHLHLAEKPITLSTGNKYRIYSIRSRGGGGGGLLFIKINLQTRLLIVTRLVNEA